MEVTPPRVGRLSSGSSRSGTAWAGGGLLATCLAVGVVAGWNPKLGLVAALGIAFVLIVLNDLTWGLLTFIFISFLDVTASAQSGSVTLTKGAGILLLASWMATIPGRKARGEGKGLLSVYPGYAITLALFIVWVGLSALWAGYAHPVADAVQRYALNMLLIPVVFDALRSRRQVNLFMGAFAVAALASTLYGFVLAPVDPTGGGRLTSLLGDPNYTAAVLVAATAILAGFLVPGRSSAFRTLTVIGASVATLAGIMATLSRGGLIALAVALVAAILYGGSLRKYAATLAAIGLVIGLAYIAVLAPSGAMSHVVSADSTGRSDLWKVALRAAEDQPVHGIGAGNFPKTAVRYLDRPGSTTRADLILHTPKVVHNTYLEELAELGVVGFLLFLAIPFFSLRCLYVAAQRFRQRGDPLEIPARALFIALIGMLAACFFISGEFIRQLWLLVATGPALASLANSHRRAAMGLDQLRDPLRLN